jgi:hypothetical protein
MQNPRLNSLRLSEPQMRAAKLEIQVLAYCKWKEAGCPEKRSLDFWLEAETEWIEYRYVPQRYPD